MNKPISIDDHVLRCSFCGGGIDRIEEHHIIRRAQGGKDTIYACDRCHRQFTENKWDLQIFDTGFAVYDKMTREKLSEVHYPPEGFDAGKFVENLGAFSREKLLEGIPVLETARDGIRCLPEGALYQVFEDAYGYVMVGLLIQAWVADSYLKRFVHGERRNAVLTLSKHLDCDPRTIYNRLAIAQLPLKRVAILPRLPARALTEAGKATDIEAAMDIVEERLAEGTGSLAIESELRAIRKGEDYQEPRLENCPCCNKQGDPKTFKWRD